MIGPAFHAHTAPTKPGEGHEKTPGTVVAVLVGKPIVVPSGKLTKIYGKSPSSMGKSIINCNFQ